MRLYEFFVQTAGFCVQLAPSAFLMLIAFGEESMKYPRKKVYLIFSAVTLSASAGFGLLEWAFIYSENMKSFANLYMTAAAAAIFFVFLRTVKTDLLSKLLVTTITVHYAAIIFTVSNFLLRIIVASGPLLSVSANLVYGAASMISFFAATAATFPMVWLFMSRVVRPALSLSDNKAVRRGFVYFITALALYCAAIMFFDYNFDRSGYTNRTVVIFFSALIITDCILYYMFFFEMKLVIENNRLMNRIQSFDEQYRRINRSIEESRRIRHDIRHHLNAIGEMNKRNETEAIAEYLEAYTNVYADSDSGVFCGYHALDNILRYYINLAREKGIEVVTEIYPVRPDIDLDVTDVTVLAGNLMENAVEACEQIPEENGRRIKLWIKQTDASLLIMIENSCRADVSPQTEFTGSENFVSTKHSKHGGQGLRSACLAAEKYGGSAEFKRENGMFTSRVVLNIP